MFTDQIRSGSGWCLPHEARVRCDHISGNHQVFVVPVRLRCCERNMFM